MSFSAAVPASHPPSKPLTNSSFIVEDAEQVHKDRYTSQPEINQEVKMKKSHWLISFFCFFAFNFSAVFGADSPVGFWKTINEKTGKADSIVGVYEYKGKYYGRLIATMEADGSIVDTIYTPKDRAPGVVGDPYYSGLDILWDLTSDGTQYKGGKIMDPEKGKVYDADMWLDNGDLIVRGELWMFGENRTWPKATDSDFPKGFKKPDLATFVPKILEVKEH